MQPTVISLFAGCGGSALGYQMAGYKDVLAVDWEDNAVETYRLNFPEVPVYHGDIANLSVEECLSLAGLKPRELDVLDGSPPCQGFSTSGLRDLYDARNQLFREYVRLLRGLQPRALIMENVSGVVRGKMKLIFAEMMRELKAAGYKVRCRLMNAKYFGVPQTRTRLIWIGLREDLNREPTHPLPQSRPITVRQALPWLSAYVNDTSGLHSAGDVLDRPIPALNHNTGHNKCIGPTPEEIAECSIESYAIAKEWRLLGPGGQSEKYFNLMKCDPDRPAPTITKTAGTLGAASLAHPYECRKFTLSELKILHSFPDDFEFTGTYSQAVERIGNSVPPLFMKAIAEHLRPQLTQR